MQKKSLILNELIKLANSLDNNNYYLEADIIDQLATKFAQHLFTWRKPEGLKEWTTHFKNFKGEIKAHRDRFNAKVLEGSDENHDSNTQYREVASKSKEETATGKGLDLTKKWVEDTIKVQLMPAQQCRNCKKMYKGLSSGWYDQFCSPFCKKRFQLKRP